MELPKKLAKEKDYKPKLVVDEERLRQIVDDCFLHSYSNITIARVICKRKKEWVKVV